jgi:hypothetical protein
MPGTLMSSRHAERDVFGEERLWATDGIVFGVELGAIAGVAQTAKKSVFWRHAEESSWQARAKLPQVTVKDCNGIRAATNTPFAVFPSLRLP